MEDLGGGRDRVAGEEAAAGVEGRDGAGFVPRHDELRVADDVYSSFRGRDVDVERPGELAPGGEALEVRLEDGRLLLAELELDGLPDRLLRDARRARRGSRGSRCSSRPSSRVAFVASSTNGHRDPGRVRRGRDRHLGAWASRRPPRRG